MATRHEFEMELRVALKPLGTTTATLAFQRLSAQLWTAANKYADLARKATSDHETAIDHERLAREIEKSAEQFVDLLKSREERFREALYLGYYTPTASLLDFMRGKRPVHVRAREILIELASEANTWARYAQASASRKPGRLTPAVRTRRLVAWWVANTLGAANLPPKTSKTGTFTKVLKVVYWASGLPRRNVHRDVCWATDAFRREAKRRIAENEAESSQLGAMVPPASSGTETPPEKS